MKIKTNFRARFLAPNPAFMFFYYLKKIVFFEPPSYKTNKNVLMQSRTPWRSEVIISRLHDSRAHRSCAQWATISEPNRFFFMNWEVFIQRLLPSHNRWILLIKSLSAFIDKRWPSRVLDFRNRRQSARAFLRNDSRGHWRLFWIRGHVQQTMNELC